jgi:hypothetical protein
LVARQSGADKLYALLLLPVSLLAWVSFAAAAGRSARQVAAKGIPVARIRRGLFDLLAASGLLAVMLGQAGYVLILLRRLAHGGSGGLAGAEGMQPGWPVYLAVTVLWLSALISVGKLRISLPVTLGVCLLAIPPAVAMLGSIAGMARIPGLKLLQDYGQLTGYFYPGQHVEEFAFSWLAGTTVATVLLLAAARGRAGAAVLLGILLAAGGVVLALGPSQLITNLLSSLPEKPAAALNMLASLYLGMASPLADLLYLEPASHASNVEILSVSGPVPVRWLANSPVHSKLVLPLLNAAYLCIVWLALRLAGLKVAGNGDLHHPPYSSSSGE